MAGLGPGEKNAGAASGGDEANNADEDEATRTGHGVTASESESEERPLSGESAGVDAYGEGASPYGCAGGGVLQARARASDMYCW